MSFTKDFGHITKEDVGLVGGKGLSLGLLTQASIPVPPGFVITTQAYQSAVDDSLDKKLELEILDAFDKLGSNLVAVRSSAIAEDSKDASWAGQFETYLNVTREDLIDSVKKCWKSADSDLVKSYAEDKSIDKDQLALAVVVQKMVESDVSGVAFSVNPISKDKNEIMIEAIFGLGELIVQGMITPDNYIVSKQSLEVIQKNISTKDRQLVYQDGQNQEVSVPEAKQDESCLSDNQLAELSTLVVTVEKYYGLPQDIEWALENDKFYIVQSRPITTI